MPPRAPSEVHETREKVRQVLLSALWRGERFYKSKNFCDSGASAKQAGQALRWFSEHPDPRFRVERWSYSHSTTWKVEPQLFLEKTVELTLPRINSWGSRASGGF